MNGIFGRHSAIVRLSSCIAVIVPSKIGKRKISAKRQRGIADKLAGKMGGWYGGATCSDGLGVWEGIHEEVIVVESFCDTKALHKWAVPTLLEALRIKKELKQESIAIRVNGALYLF
jgi:hypothetical protein